MAQAIREISFRQAAFRSCSTGAVICTGAFHDITLLPGGLDADLDEWQAGFTDSCGRFLDRSAAAEALGLPGRLESRGYFAGEPSPTLEAGRTESWRRIVRMRSTRSAPPRAPSTSDTRSRPTSSSMRSSASSPSGTAAAGGAVVGSVR